MVRRIRKFIGRKYLVAACLALVAIIIGSVLIIQRSSKQNSTTIPSTTNLSSDKASAGSTGQSTSGSDSSAGQTDKNASNLTTSGSGPAKPFGNFVSNHSPGNGLSTQEESTCNTTPGASCYIQFTMGSSTKKLDAQTTDSSGTVYWTWDVKNAGLTEGSWQITAVATLNGQTATTQDQIPLKIQP